MPTSSVVTTRTEQLDSWKLVYGRGVDPHGQYLFDSVQIFKGNRALSRITFAKPRIDVDEAQRQLSERARQWIGDYEERTTAAGPDQAQG